MEISDVFGNLPVIETERLRLRKMRLDDRDDVFAYASDPLLTMHTIWDYHRSIEDSANFLNHMLACYDRQEAANWGIEYKANRKMIGTCGFVYWDTNHNRAEVGYALSRAYWNQGIMTEAIREVAKFGFTVMNLNRLEARCNVDNIGSERVMQKIGMTFEGILREQLVIKGKYEDIKMYAILKSEMQ